MKECEGSNPPEIRSLQTRVKMIKNVFQTTSGSGTSKKTAKDLQKFVNQLDSGLKKYQEVTGI